MITQARRPKDSISITIESHLIEVIDEIRRETNTTRSGIISKCLEEFAQRRMTRLMEEGYREMAEENRLLAEQSLPIVMETWPRQSEDS